MISYAGYSLIIQPITQLCKYYHIKLVSMQRLPPPPTQGTTTQTPMQWRRADVSHQYLSKCRSGARAFINSNFFHATGSNVDTSHQYLSKCKGIAQAFISSNSFYETGNGSGAQKVTIHIPKLFHKILRFSILFSNDGSAFLCYTNGNLIPKCTRKYS